MHDRMKYQNCDFSQLIGHVIEEIRVQNNEAIVFKTEDGSVYKMTHEQDCCEDVYIEDIIGDLYDLKGHPILQAEETSNEGEADEWQSSTWTFYKLATIKGSVTIRWLGTSNGYYSERADFLKFKGP